MSDARHLKDLISRYWNLAYAEGKEGRTHDTLAGDAAACLHDIEQAIKALEGRSQPAQAVPLLTDEDIWNDDHIMGMNAFLGLPMETIVSIVRAAVPLVRSKLGAGVPMTRQQTDAMFAEVQRRANQLADEGRYSFGGWFPIAVELIEAHHGIVGKEGWNASV